MNEIRNFKALLKTALTDSLPAQITAHADDAGITLSAPSVKTGYANPFQEVDQFPEIRIFEVRKKGYERQIRKHVLGVRLFVVVQSDDAEDEADVMSEAIGATVEDMPGSNGIYDVDGLTIGVFLGPPDVKQMAVGTIDFDVLL